VLVSTFQHFKGITPHKEHKLWESGIVNWDDLEEKYFKQLSFFYFEDHHELIKALNDSRKALKKNDVGFFVRSLPRNEHYRIATSFLKQTMFLDIETTGLSKYYDKITLIGWSIGDSYNVYIRGEDPKKFLDAISTAKVIVTFNGSLFDLPFIHRDFPESKLPQCHIDLRFLAKRVDLSGGQKLIEKKLKLRRANDIADIEGEEAALLWYQYRWGDSSALQKLIIYNRADIEGMKKIFDEVITRLVRKKDIPFSKNSIPKFFKKENIRDINHEKRIERRLKKIAQFEGNYGPSIQLPDLSKDNAYRKIKVVGIDLTGSESRPTGWCFLDNDLAQTKKIDTDKDIINETINLKPDIISIDSPLSMPRGRISVFDDDPGRDKFGIMRECERTLKRRGINVYPSLIPSMQRLTQRGTYLANQFRALGFPVIECYPGAAQDIMEIPRKGASLEFLAKGLEQFGIKGNFLVKSVSHDELDAITAAVVGHFFWNGKFEALGNEEEEYLVIPDLKKDNSPWWKTKVVGLSGPIASGKTTAGRILEKNGYVYGRFSMVIKKMLEDKKIPVTRENLQKFGDEVNKNPGQRWLGHQLLAVMPKEGNIVIDGLRFPEDHALLRETYGPQFLHVHLEASKEIRLTRCESLGISTNEFESADSHNVERMTHQLSKFADLILPNDENDLKKFEDKLIENIVSIKHKKRSYDHAN
jgi:uncharacterized protein YprB with RNaseH-like and TPR domain/predicted nuclease with RNAse H fold/dephospho-CoA kinase